MASEDPKTLKKIRSSVVARSLTLAKLSAVAGAKAAAQFLATAGADDAKRAEGWQGYLQGQAENLAHEFGKLKGSILKAGQMLSVYGEHFFPPEINDLLKSMQSETPPVEFAVLEKVVRQALGKEKLARLEIDPTPHAAASLGQVHLTRIKGDARTYALKIQYPGVEHAIGSDLASLRTILSVMKVVPRGPSYDAIFDEIKAMLHREVDYGLELTATADFRALLSGDPRFIVPEPIPEFSARHVLMTTYEEGVRLDGDEVKALSQDRRNQLATAALELFLNEVFVWGKVQTDPHFGNYRVRLDDGTGIGDRWVLYDFGAVRDFPKPFLGNYYRLIHSGLGHDRDGFAQAAGGLGVLLEDDLPDVREALYRLGRMVLEPFEASAPSIDAKPFFDANGAYDWGRSDLPKRTVASGLKIVFNSRPRSPVREIIFLDRKLAGVFTVIANLKARIAGRPLLLRHLEHHGLTL